MKTEHNSFFKRTVTFKKGKVLNFYSEEATLVKLNRKVVGEIVVPRLLNFKLRLFKIRFTVQKNNGWEWMTLDKEFETEEEARRFIKDQIITITQNVILCGQS